jgi:hypothetical protein
MLPPCYDSNRLGFEAFFESFFRKLFLKGGFERPKSTLQTHLWAIGQPNLLTNFMVLNLYNKQSKPQNHRQFGVFVAPKRTRTTRLAIDVVARMIVAV